MVKVAVYGSLRRDQYNYRFMKSAKAIDTLTVDGYIMLSFGDYPAVIPARGNSILCDIIEVDKFDWKRISKMEKSAGYKLDWVEYKEEKIPMWVYDIKVIEAGDWVDYIKSV